MNFIERCILIVELAGWEYGLPWWATWLAIAALVVYLYGIVRMTVECWRDEVNPALAVAIIVLWPLVWLLVNIWDDEAK